MNWDAAGAIGEIVGALAVVISLIYLATQIRVQNREARIASAHEISEGFRNAIASARDPQIAKLIVKVRKDFDGLDEAEMVQMFSIAQSYLRVWEEAHYQHQQNRLDESMWKAMNAQFLDMMELEAFQRPWELRKHTYREEFQSFIENSTFGELKY